jgi:hypothetical protein
MEPRFSVALLLLASAFGARASPVNATLEAATLEVFDHGASHTADHLGRKCFYLEDGIALVRGAELRDGSIDVDLATSEKADAGFFFGIGFRLQRPDQSEVVYLRKGSSGRDEALQYAPELNGAIAWQLFTGPGASATATVPDNEWFHLRIVIAGRVARIFVADSNAPTLEVPRLSLGGAGAGIALWGRFKGGAYFSNLRYEPDPKAGAAPALEADYGAEPGLLADWEISKAYAVAETDPEKYPDQHRMQWEHVHAEPQGFVLLNRYRRSPEVLPRYGLNHPLSRRRVERPIEMAAGALVVFARTTIHADRARLQKLSVGYSDNVTVFLNGRALFSGNNAFSYREPDEQGYVNVNNDSVFLTLNRGSNELMLAVSEYFGGWGFICRFVGAEISGVSSGVN